MKIFKKRKLPPREINDLVGISCDICGVNGIDERRWKESPSINGTKIYMEIGDVWPDGGDWVETSYDICPDCFQEKLMPWLAEQGANPRVEEKDC